MKNYKKIFAAFIAAAAIAGCIPAKPTYKKELTLYDYGHRTHETPLMLNAVFSEELNIDYCIVSTLEYNNEYNYYTVYAFSSYYNREMCIADDITPETAKRLYFPGSELMRFWFPDTPYYTADIVLINKP